MKISYKNIKKFIDLDHTPEELGVVLTSTGLEVEGIDKVEAIKGGLEGLVIGKVITCEKHPDADKLNLTKVDIGGDELLDIVCGAPNVAAGQKVIVAQVGTTLYPTEGEAFTIKKSKIRGQASNGMLCAEDEIGLGKSHAGLLILDTELPLGTPISKYFNLEADYVFEIGLTPNRADAASHFGVARDIKAVTGLPLKLPDVSAFAIGTEKATIDLKVEATDACPRFCGLEIRNVEVKESPEWLKTFLKTLGMNPINNIVDITNYVCHFLGQPMHIFDADEIKGNQVIVKKPAKDTELETLDGVKRKFTGNDLAICNEEEPMAIAGVFGGSTSGVKETTKNIFLEVAYFDPAHVRKTSSHFGLKTDASFRYERGTDPNMPPFAIRFAALLVQELAGGQLTDKLFDNYPEPIANFEFDVKIRNIDRLIGKSIGEEKITQILKSLDIDILHSENGTLKVSVPPFRVDVTREADIVEEILRIYGFDNVELSDHLSSDFISDFPVKDEDSLRVRLSEALAANGFNEIQSLSIVSPKENGWIGDPEASVKLLNPLSEDLSEMRQSLLFSALNAAVYNINRRNKDLKMFEFGRVYTKTVNAEGKTKIKERKVLSMLLTGKTSSESWAEKADNTSYKHIHQAVKQVLTLMKLGQTDNNETASPYFAYGLDYMFRNKQVVKFGLVSSDLLKKADMKQAAYYAEFDWDFLMNLYSSDFKYVEIPKFPEVRRDLSLVISDDVKFDTIQKLAFQTEKKLLKNVNIFDVYKGDKLDSDKKSYSVSFILQDAEKTLNDQQIDKTMQKLMGVFEKEVGAVIRK
jgi:phenylalanyl-tRNA synthetase beta chain